MSRKISKEVGDVSWGCAYVITEGAPNHIVGRVLTLVEAIGLPNKQEEALKGLITQAVWQFLEDAIYISADRHSEIRGAYFEAKEKAQTSNVPCNAI